ncbi:gibberellin 2-beta-dioxygenase [Phtheirospermum japonicum]|uniref:gibberellin 2beta-dioxygenase n=1 Tax=Phtheirospermum japonicum TaxID=374723 RepID=A0A830B0V4_9LAMI|nr:gibberellin 2-beta-dioxygenase [Phtheirospermum japonicum]
MMQALSHPVNNMVHNNINTCMPACHDTFTGIPVVDLSDPNAKTQIARAFQEVGFFKVANHGVSVDFLTQLEEEAVDFFKLPEQQKETSGPTSPLGYGHKNIGPNGDMGWLEYLLFNTNPELNPPHSMFPGIQKTLWGHVNEYVHAVRNMTCLVLEMIGDELRIESSDKLSEMIRNENSDSCFRVNYYPPCPEIEALSGRSLIGFGEHTDPQIISVIRSNDTSGLQICLSDGTWVSVPPDHTTFFFIVGDSLQVMTNGKFRSVKHRVVTNNEKLRVSMIYFGGPTMDERIAPLAMKEGEQSLYKDFTWNEYKTFAYSTKLGVNRLALFQKSVDVAL